MSKEDLSDIKISNLASLECALWEVGKRWGGVELLWRGHANSDWLLKAEVFRSMPNQTLYDETSLLGYFTAYARTRHQHCPEKDDLFAWLLLARHYGLPTRMMDWSTSPLVALYFAINDETVLSGDGCLWALHAGLLNKHMLGGGSPRLMPPDGPEITTLISAATVADRTMKKELANRHGGQVLACGPYETDARMLVQQGAFTVHSDATDLATIAMAPSEPWRRAFIIPADAKAELRNLLGALGIRSKNLFPDLHTLARELKLRHILNY